MYELENEKWWMQPRKPLMYKCKNAIRACKLETILVDFYSTVCKGRILTDEYVWPNAIVSNADENHVCRWMFF